MTTTAATTPTPSSLNPQIVGQAEIAHAAVLTRALAGTGVTKNGWIVLTMTVTAGEPVERDQLVGHVAGALKTDRDTALAAITSLTAGIIARAYDGITAEDLAVAARVLTTITAGLTRELAAS